MSYRVGASWYRTMRVRRQTYSSKRGPQTRGFGPLLTGLPELALKGDLGGAKAALADSLKLKPEVNSLAQWYAYLPWCFSIR
jgi:hypothetical protein